MRSRAAGRAPRGPSVLAVLLPRAPSGEAEAGGRRSRRSAPCDRAGQVRSERTQGTGRASVCGAGPPGAPAFEQVRSRKQGCPCLTLLRGPKRKQRNWAPAPSDNGAALWTCALRLQSLVGQDPLPGLPAPPWGPDLLLGFVVLSDYSNPRQGPRNGGTHV